jgi:hypothetical protein
VTEDKWNFVFVAEICQPVPTEHTFHTDDEVLEIGENQVVKCLGVRFDVLVNLGFSLVIDDAYIHFPCMQIDAAIVLVLLIVESHGLASFHLNGFCFGDPILNL